MNLSLDRNSDEWQDWLRTVQHFFSHGDLCPLIINKVNDNRPYIEIKILDRSFIGLLDSGANRSVINMEFAERLRSLGFESNPIVNSKIATADGISHGLSAIFDVPITFDDQFHVISLRVMDKSVHKLILGKDFFDTFGISLKFRNCVNDTSTLCPVSDIPAIISKEDLDVDKLSKLNLGIEEIKSSIGHGLGRTELLKHTIDTGSHKPVHQRQYSFSPVIKQQIEAELDKMLESDVVEPSYSEWCSPILLVKKPNGENRLCLDSRQLNKVTKRDTYPLPRVATILDNLNNAKFLSTIDLKSAFWQISLEESSKEKTAFAVPGRGLFQFKVMPFGLVNASQTQQRLMDILFQPHEGKVWTYLDDIIICSESFEEHIRLLKMVTETLKKANLTINVDKCKFARSSLKYLGYIVDKEGLRTDPEKVSAILNFPRPKNFTELKRFIGLASWYRRFVKNFSLVAAPLHNLTKGKKKKQLDWSSEAEQAFITLKTLLTTTPVMACPNYTLPFTIQCDASNEGIGSVLCQKVDGHERAIAFLSRKLTDIEKRYSTSERELLSVVYAVEKFRPYVDGTHFTIITDHSALQWLHKMKDPHGRLARWAMKLQQFSFDIIHKPGKSLVVPDALSRAVWEVNILEISEEHMDEFYYNKIKELQNAKVPDPEWSIRNGLLYRKLDLKQYPDRHYIWKLYIPEALRPEILRVSHDNPRSGHLGIRKTLYRIKKDYYWPKISEDVKNYVRNCEVCAKHKVSQDLPFGKMGQNREVSRPWQLISLDLMGPFPKSKRGNTMLLVITCLFSKLNLLFPLRTAKADKVSEILEDQILLYGSPLAVICDNGKQFNCKIFKELAAKYNYKIWFTPNYHPQSNPTERVNRVIGTMISAFINGKKHNEWDLHIKEVGHAIRTAVHDTTGYTPSYLFFGRETGIPDIELPKSAEVSINGNQDMAVNLDEFMDQLNKRNEIYHEVQTKIKQAHETSTKVYNLRRRQADFKVGDTVWRKTKHLSNADNKFMAKLAPKFEKAIITDKKSDNVFTLRNMSGKEIGTWHAKDLKLI